MLKIYLAGPDVFREDPASYFNELKRIALGYKVEAISPFDSGADATSAQRIFDANVGIMNRVDAVVANLIPFRGVSVDDGTAFEMGYAFSRGLTIFGYTPYYDKNIYHLTKAAALTDKDQFPEVENFNHPCNLMIAEAIRASGGIIYPVFEDCIRHLVNAQKSK